MRLAAVCFSVVSCLLGLVSPVFGGVADIRGGDIERTWSAGFWEYGVGLFDSIRLDWVSGQMLAAPFIMNFDVDGADGAPYGADGWKILAGDAYSVTAVNTNLADWLGFDLQFKAPESPTIWMVRAYEGEMLKDMELIVFDGTSWTFQPLGGCCNPDGTCQLSPEVDCRRSQGIWLGQAQECSLVTCQQVPAETMSWGRVRSLFR